VLDDDSPSVRPATRSSLKEPSGNLSSLPSLAVVARSSTIGDEGTAKSPQEIAQELEVSYLLTGTVRWHEDGATASRIRVMPELVEVGGEDPPTTRWHHSFEAVVEDVFRVQGEITTKVAGALQVALGDEAPSNEIGQSHDS
jgi:TolB-like protein